MKKKTKRCLNWCVPIERAVLLLVVGWGLGMGVVLIGGCVVPKWSQLWVQDDVQRDTTSPTPRKHSQTIDG